MSENKYWQGFAELNDSENFQKKNHDEFRDELPFEDFDSKGLIDAKAPRRDFLKYLGFSTAAATLAASCQTKVRQAIPFAYKPQELIPGEAKYYATTYLQDGDAVPIVAKVREGRPIKIEGNEQAYTKGGTTARVQASVLDLYDSHRLRFPVKKSGTGFTESTFDELDKAITAELAAATQIVLLTSTIHSPTTLEIISKFPKLRHVQYDAISYSGMLQANEAAGFGRVLPSYKLEAADVIVSLGADFLGTWLNPIEQAAGYAAGRRINENAPKMSKHYQFESFLSMTGSNADERFTHRPSQTGAVAVALLAALKEGVTAPVIADTALKAGIAKVAADLKAAHGKAVVLSGSNDVHVQTVINAINDVIGANGTTIDWVAHNKNRKGVDKEFSDLLTQMESGQVGAILIQGANPAYHYFDAERFKKALSKVGTSVSFGERLDETTELCKYVLPTSHFLECWGDAEPKAGYFSFMQPTIDPLFKTRPYQDSLLKWNAGGNTTTSATGTYDVYFREYWTTKLGGKDAFNKILQEGVYTQPTTGSVSYNGATSGAAVAAIAAYPVSSQDELALYENVGIGSGSGAINPWLQELPDPVGKSAWGNFAMISMAKAKELDIKLDTEYEYHPEKPVISIQTAKTKIELPVLVVPGMNPNTIAVAVGYGRSANLGRTAGGVGQNVYPFSSLFGDNINYSASRVTVASTGRKEKVAQSQIHNSYEGRVEVLRETTLATYKTYPDEIKNWRQNLVDKYAASTGDFRKEGTMYGVHQTPGIKWGMNVDMNACVGCAACVVACHAENNVPVVGKAEVLRFHDMHWLRIDRYFVSDEKNPDNLKGVVFQPMMCQHCDNAPCENVCPVAATNHSEEGLNQMAYNRCIGTRYCANNCPFKVRRFNWADYNGADSFPNNQDQKTVGKLDPVVSQMNDPISRMVLNPDVTVRSRGVMEKCSFCVQRLQHAKLEAKKNNRPMKDGEAKTACQQACPTDAIVFGDVHDKESAITKIRLDNPRRLFYSLEQLHVLPNVSYFSKIRNTEEVLGSESHKGGVEGGKHSATIPSAAGHNADTSAHH